MFKKILPLFVFSLLFIEQAVASGPLQSTPPINTQTGNASSPTPANTNVLIYDASSSNFGGIGVDPSGNIYIVNGTSSPAAHLYIGASGGVNIGGTSDPGLGALSTTGTINTGTGYKVGGVALSASNLSNGVSGTGSVILQSGATITSPTINGTGSSGNYTLSNSGIIVNNSAGSELLRMFASGPNGGSGNYGADNFFLGWHSGQANPSDNTSAGYFNQGVGYQTLVNNTTGFDNVAAGISSLEYNTTGNYNTGYGVGTLEYQTTASNNSGFGHHVLTTNVSSPQNSGFGDSCLTNLASGTGNNTCTGYTGLFNLTTGANNTADGSGALAGVTTGNSNIGIGINAGSQINTQSNITVIGNYTASGAASNDIYVSDGVGNVVFAANPITPFTRLPYVTGGPGPLCADGTGNLSVCKSSTSARPTNPTGSALGSYVMMGLGASCSFTPQHSSRMLVTINGNLNNTTSGALTKVSPFYGTGTAPANGVATTGTQAALIQAGQVSGTNWEVPFSFTWTLSSLTPGTAEWVDLAMIVSAGTGTVTDIYCQGSDF